MKKFKSLFYRKNKMVLVTSAIYSVMFVVFVLFIVKYFSAIASDSFLMIASVMMPPYILFMLLRSLYFIFETVEVDEAKREIRLCIIRKRVPFDAIRSIRMVRPCQMRIEATDGIIPFSVEDEEAFKACVTRVAPAIRFVAGK